MTTMPAALDTPPRLPRLLVVDDQPANIQVLYEVFSADHQVLMATRGAQALTLCANKLPDLVLLDVNMPDLDGLEVCRRLKADDITRDIPVIFVTAHDDERAETLGLEAGAVDFISKPINPRIVRARVKTQLTLKAQSDLLRRWVYIDGLTGVCNRRGFDERLANEAARARRNGSPLSVVLLDVDYFKRYNDHYGHQAGDDVLRRLGAALRDSVRRPGDLVARYGGEEFVCLLPETTLAGARALASQIGERVQALQIPHADAPLGALTVSLGTCAWSGAGPFDVESLVREADAQLYQAKLQGRNRHRGIELPSG